MKRKLLPLATVLLGTILSACGFNGTHVMRYGPPPPPRYEVVAVAPAPGFVQTGNCPRKTRRSRVTRARPF